MLVVKFEKSLVIPYQDFEIFKNETYRIDDGTVHIYYENEYVLLVLDKDKKPSMSVKFQAIKLENKQCYEIEFIKHKLDKVIDPEHDMARAQREVYDIIAEVFNLLDGILLKRTKANKDSKKIELYNYYVRDKNKKMFDRLTLFNERISYLQLLPKLQYIFWFFDESNV